MTQARAAETSGLSQSRRRIIALIVAAALPATAACLTVTVPEAETAPTPPPAPKVTTVPLVARYTVNCETRSPSGYGAAFHDPRSGGECWACPNSNPIRTWSPVTAGDACATRSVAGIGAKATRARYLGPYDKCPNGDVQVRGSCSYCPAGSAWSQTHGACVKR
jgi:hypothetical protein